MLRLRTLAAATAMWLAAASASAHSKPKVMVPAADSVVSAPASVSVVFTEALEPKFSSLQLTDEKGTVVSKAASKLDPADAKHMTLELPSLAPGVYYVHWVTASADGHHMEGDYKFSVK
jgi:methionine-rich copper-binding protein CopC